MRDSTPENLLAELESKVQAALQNNQLTSNVAADIAELYERIKASAKPAKQARYKIATLAMKLGKETLANAFGDDTVWLPIARLITNLSTINIFATAMNAQWHNQLESFINSHAPTTEVEYAQQNASEIIVRHATVQAGNIKAAYIPIVYQFSPILKEEILGACPQDFFL